MLRHRAIEPVIRILLFNCFYCGHDKDHKREIELTIPTMRAGGDPTIPILELIEVTQSTSAMECHW